MIAIDEPIPPDEPLYRGIGPDHVDGDAVLEAAIDMQGTSVFRAKYCVPNPPTPPLRSSHPHEDGIAVTSAAELPRYEIGGIEYVFFVVHEPEEGDAHCGIHVRRATDPSSERSTFSALAKRSKKELRQLLRAELAACFHVLAAPR